MNELILSTLGGDQGNGGECVSVALKLDTHERKRCLRYSF